MLRRRRWACVDCGYDCHNEHYMLKDDIWDLVHNSPYGMMCIGCVESHLGRSLRKDDFTPVWVNQKGHTVQRSARLSNRLFG